MLTVLEMLKLELNKKEYFEDNEYGALLQIQGLNPSDTYNNEKMRKQLLLTVLDILEKVSNDTDMMRKIGTEIGDQTSAYENLTKQIDRIKDKIIDIEDKENNKQNKSCFMMYYTYED